MNKLKIIRWISWIAVAVVLAWAALHYAPSSSLPVVQLAPKARPFHLTTQHGKAFTEKDIAGKPYMIFFGFSYCPAICPGALADMTLWLEKLGKDADAIHTLFISLDPERDTPAHLKDYMKSYDARIIALTGTREATDAIAAAYGIFHKKMPMDDQNYMIDHSASVYLYDKHGGLISTIDMQENRDIAFAKIKKLIDENR